MNRFDEQQIRYRLLRLLAEEPGLSQREMAQRMGISLGKLNYCVSQLAARGWIKIHRFKSARRRLPYLYKLTPSGLDEMGRLTVRFLRLKIAEYEEIRRQIRELAQEAEAHSALDETDRSLLEAAERIT